MIIYKVLHPKDNIVRLYVSRKEGESIDVSIDPSIQRLEDYTKKHEGGLITAIGNDINYTKANSMTIKKTKVGRKTTLWTF